MIYANPIISGFHPDPSICDDNNGGFYLVTSTFEYLPGVPVFHSKDLLNWECIGHCLERSSQVDLSDTPPSGGIFAPTIRRRGDTFYMITTNVSRGVFYVTSKNPRTGWSDPIFLNGVRGIDPSFTFIEDRTYVQIAMLGEGNVSCIGQTEIDIETGELLTELRPISYGTGGRDVEAPHIYIKDGTYFLLCAEGGTREGHMVTIQKSDSIWGPFVGYEKNPILSNRDKPNEALQAVGHADLIEDSQGNWWCVALAHRAIQFKHVLGRETILLPAKWPAGGWPEIDIGFARRTIEMPLLNCQQKQKNKTVDTFSTEKLPYYWNKLRMFKEQYYRIDSKKQELILTGQDITLNDVSSPTFLCRRQEQFDFDFTVELNYQPSEQGEAGISAYMDPTHHMDFAIQKSGDQTVLFVRKTVADLVVESARYSITSETITLKITGDKTHYHFYFIQNDQEIFVEKTLTKHLATEVADSPFTGVYLGIYVYHDKDQATIKKVTYVGDDA